MELNEYQERAMETCMSASYNFSYMFLNLVGEVGEFASKVAKNIRKGNIAIGADAIIKAPNELLWTAPGLEGVDAIEDELKKEAGDIMWQFFGLCEAMGWDAENIARINLDKLASRKSRGVIDGSGDNR